MSEPSDAAKVICKIADVAEAIAFQAGVGGSETAGMIVSYLAKNPDRIEHVLANGIIDEPDLWVNGRLSWQGQNGKIITPRQARLARIVSSMRPQP
jgi:hypothetical protein